MKPESASKQAGRSNGTRKGKQRCKNHPGTARANGSRKGADERPARPFHDAARLVSYGSQLITTESSARQATLKALKAKLWRTIIALEKAMEAATTDGKLMSLSYAFINACREYRSLWSDTEP